METNENMTEKRKQCYGPGRRAGWIALGIVAFTGFAFLFGAVIMWLWNGLMPVIFHLGVITYWQAIGLAILGRLLFGSMHHGGRHHKGPHKFGPWRGRHFRNYDYHCRDHSGYEKWKFYEQYWNEEGEKSFDDYVKRKTSDTPQ
jgi:hypothetical protein